MTLHLRPMTTDDLPMLARWLAEPQVLKWWAEDPAKTAERYTPELAKGITSYEIAVLDGQDVGMIQRYPIAAYQEFVDELSQAGVPLPDGAWSVDYFIAEPSARGRGLGRQMITMSVERVWGDESATAVVVPVHADNPASAAALRSVGFEQLPGEFEMEPDNPEHDRRHVVLRMDRPVG